MPRTLADVHQSLINMEKQAAASRPGATDDAELEKRAEAIARAEMEKEAAIQKTAAEYDAAGRIMARGFADEFQKCMAEIEKVGMEGFVAGQVENDLEPSSAPIPTTGMAPKQHNKELNSTEGVKGKLGPGGAPAIITVKSMQEAAQPTPRAAATDLGGGA